MSYARALCLGLTLPALVACGRGLFEPSPGSGTFGRGDGGGGTGGDGSGPVDFGVDATLFDTGTTPRDGGGRRDGGRRPDAEPRDLGTDIECLEPFDCFGRFGEPFCPDGNFGRWECIENKCQVSCPPPPVCRTDCDCPIDLGCVGGSCSPVNRLNQCCFNPFCPAGQSCVFPDGQTGVCESFDAGIPFPDGGPPFDGGPGFDGGPIPDGGIGTPCRIDCDCDPSLSCIRGVCLAVSSRQNNCCTSPFCPAGGTCQNPDGTPGTCGPTTPVGASCFSSPECGAIGFCIEEASGFPGGYCTQQCGMGGSPCPPGAVCRNTGGGESFCLDACADPMECRPEYNCVQLGINPERVCWPIPEGSTNPNGAPVGSACSVDQECLQGLSCMTEQDGFPGGYCTRPYCDPRTNPCPNGSSCFAFPGLFSLCLADCPSGGSRSTCRRGYYCLGPTGSPGVCISN